MVFGSMILNRLTDKSFGGRRRTPAVFLCCSGTNTSQRHSTFEEHTMDSHKADMDSRSKLACNLGFSLIELIIVIAVMAVLVGLVAPAFARFVDSHRKSSCLSDREALLTLYERSVYEEVCDITDTSFGDFLSGTMSGSANDVAEYMNKCPKGGHYTHAIIDDHIARITCDACGDFAEIDLTGWKGSGDETGEDPTVVPPPYTEEYTDETTEEESTTEEPPTIEDPTDGYWPYQNTSKWYKTQKGPIAGSTIAIKTPSCIQTSKSGSKYVVVGEKSGGTWNIEYEKAISPEYLFTIDAQHVVILSGVYLHVDFDDLSSRYKNAQNWNWSKTDAYNDGYFMNYGDWNSGIRYFDGVQYGDVLTVTTGGKTRMYVYNHYNNSGARVQFSKSNFGKYATDSWALVCDKDAPHSMSHGE